MSTDSSSLVTAAWSFLVLVVFLLLWQFGPGWLGVPEFVLPPLTKVLAEAARIWDSERLLWHAGITTLEVVIGFVLGSILGALIGYALGVSPRVEAVLSPYLLALQIAPKVAFAPLFVMWLGYTIYPKILVAILIVFFPVLINVLSAMRAMDHDMINLARSFSATRMQVFTWSSTRPRCRRCSPGCASPARWRSSVWWWANSSAATWAWATCWSSSRARATRRRCSW
jgi:NitT/TauT family transport system permease protein